MERKQKKEIRAKLRQLADQQEERNQKAIANGLVDWWIDRDSPEYLRRIAKLSKVSAFGEIWEEFNSTDWCGCPLAQIEGGWTTTCDIDFGHSCPTREVKYEAEAYLDSITYN